MGGKYKWINPFKFKDLKSENVLVWRFPSPNAPGRQKSLPPTDVLLKLGDYGISRFSYPSGVCKGYGGTEVRNEGWNC